MPQEGRHLQYKRRKPDTIPASPIPIPEKPISTKTGYSQESDEFKPLSMKKTVSFSDSLVIHLEDCSCELSALSRLRLFIDGRHSKNCCKYTVISRVDSLE